MFWRARSFWIAAGATAYVAFAALRSTERAPLPLAFLAALPVVLAVVWSLTEAPPRGEDRVEATARGASRITYAGTAIFLAARSGPGTPAFVACENLGAALAATGSLVALARIGSLGGLLAAPVSARRLEAAAVGTLLWTVAVGLPGARAVAEIRTSDLDPLLIDYATVAASVCSLGMALVMTTRVRVTRRLELGVADRAGAALVLTVTALAVGLVAGFVGVAPPEKLLPLLSVVASVAIASSAVAPEATSMARALRTILGVTVLVTPVALFAVYAARRWPGKSGPALFLACGVAGVLGLLSPRLARRFAPEGARWLGALESATRAAMNPDPDAALESALLALRSASGHTAADPALYQLALPEVVRVDRAGYSHRERADLPPRLQEVAEEEPEQIFRVEVGRSAEVKRPDVRSLVAWLDQRSFAAVAVVRDETSAIGLLAIPRGGRRAPMTLEEVRALRFLCDRLGATVGVSALLARSRAREVELRHELEAQREDHERLTRTAARDAERLRAVARMLARPALVASYSPAARGAIEQLERLGHAQRPIMLLSAPGVDAIAWAAVAHLASERRDGPLTLVDGTNAAEHDLARWRDPAESPLRATAEGSLVLVDAHVLPPDVQSYVAAALPEGAGLILSAPSTIDVLVATGRMSERLADRLGDRAVALPTLASRSEDLRALCIEHLARIGVRLQSNPLGLHPAALAILLEHTWPGNDAELYATLLRAALVAQGGAITPIELERIGFDRGAREEAVRPTSTIPPPRSRRKSR